MQVVVEFHIGLDQDLASAQDVVREAALTSRYVHLPKPVVVLVRQTFSQGLVALELVLEAYVLDTQHEKAVETDVTVRVLRAFRERGIQPPPSSTGTWTRRPAARRGPDRADQSACRAGAAQRPRRSSRASAAASAWRAAARDRSASARCSSACLARPPPRACGPPPRCAPAPRPPGAAPVPRRRRRRPSAPPARRAAAGSGPRPSGPSAR